MRIISLILGFVGTLSVILTMIAALGVIISGILGLVKKNYTHFKTWLKILGIILGIYILTLILFALTQRWV